MVLSYKYNVPCHGYPSAAATTYIVTMSDTILKASLTEMVKGAGISPLSILCASSFE